MLKKFKGSTLESKNRSMDIRVTKEKNKSDPVLQEKMDVNIICDIINFLESRDAHTILDLFHSTSVSNDVKQIKQSFKDGSINLESYEIHALAGALKAYLMEDEQFISTNFSDKCIRAIENNINSSEDQIRELVFIFSGISVTCKLIFSKLLPFLAKVISSSETTKLTISITFAPIFLRAYANDPVCMLRRSPTCAKLMALIIVNHSRICAEMSKFWKGYSILDIC